MLREELIFVGTCDIAGHVRGEGFPARELAARKKQGIGWTHTNLMQTAFGTILDTPFGTGGDLMVVPASTRARRTRVFGLRLRRTESAVLHVDDEKCCAAFDDRPVACEGLSWHHPAFPASQPSQQVPAGPVLGFGRDQDR